MSKAAHAISNQRLDRLMLWSKLWLLRFADYILQAAGAWAPLERALERALKPQIGKLAELVLALIVLKAAAGASPPKKHRRYGPAREAGNDMRVLVGARLRKLVRARDLRARISTLLVLLSKAESEISRCAKRLSAGLGERGGVFAHSALMASYGRQALLTICICSADTS